MTADPLTWLQQAATEAAPVPVTRRTGPAERTDVSSRWAWTNDAACANADQEVFYPVKSFAKGPLPAEILADARIYCDHCPVRGQCLDHALHNETEGIWAGTDNYVRRKLRNALGIAINDADPLEEPDPIDPPPLEDDAA